MNINFEEYLEYLYVTGQLDELELKKSTEKSKPEDNKPKEKTLKKK